MPSHTSDWFPGRVSPEYQDNYEKIFGGTNGLQQTETETQITDGKQKEQKSSCCEDAGCVCPEGCCKGH